LKLSQGFDKATIQKLLTTADQVKLKLESETSVGFIESDDFDQRQANVDDDRLSVVDHRPNVSTVTVWIEQRREKSVLVCRCAAPTIHLTYARYTQAH